MADIVRLLPDHVANQIAAGEVIQRPASVVKELVENSLDAGATHIDILITDAGKTCIQVIDDGKGMSPIDARMSFERHATSKIKDASDLFNLHTMGFRGEALASIAAVAQVELKTRQSSDDLGVSVQVEGSKFLGQEPVMCASGSNFQVKNLFYNVPARRKFLKADSTELNNILTEFERIVLVHPEVGFTFHHNGKEQYNLSRCGKRQRICDVFGHKMNQQLLSVEVETSFAKISGFVGKPEFSRKKGAQQYFFVNGRYMKHPYFHKAVMGAYEHLVPEGEQVNYFIYFEVNPEEIDVNIHPTKTEIKFENDTNIWPILMAAVKESLGKFNAVPTIDFDTIDKPDIPVFQTENGGGGSMPEVHYNPSFNPFAQEKPLYKEREARNLNQWEHLYAQTQRKSSYQETAGQTLFGSGSLEEPQAEPVAAAPSSDKSYLQHKGRFIVTSVKSGLMIVDQHRAHIRVLYDMYRNQLKNNSGTSQGQLFPEVVQFSPSESLVLELHLDAFKAIGFDMENLGGGSYSVNGIPAGAEGIDVSKILHEMIEVSSSDKAQVAEELHFQMALTLAKFAAIPVGQVLSQDEMNDLVGRLLASPTPNYTPDGKAILRVLSEEETEKMF